jgi:hypothetical protein
MGQGPCAHMGLHEILMLTVILDLDRLTDIEFKQNWTSKTTLLVTVSIDFRVPWWAQLTFDQAEICHFKVKVLPMYTYESFECLSSLL